MPPIPEQAQLAPLPFPLQGIDLSQAFGAQHAFTTPVGVNVRTWESLTQRGRGGSRPGLEKYIPAQVPAGTTLIQELQPVTVVDPNAAAPLAIAFVQSNQKGYASGAGDLGFVQSATAGFVSTATVTVVLTGVVKNNVLMLFAVNDFDGVSGGVTPTDNLSSAWALLHADNSTSNYNCAGYYAVAGASGDCTISLTGFGGAHNWRLVALEYAGLDIHHDIVNGPLDHAGNGVFGASPLTFTPSATVTGEVAVGYVGNPFGNHAFTTTDTYTTRRNLDGSAADGCPLRVMDAFPVNHGSEPQAEATFSVAADSVMNVFTFAAGTATGTRSISYTSDVVQGNLLLFAVTTNDSGSLPLMVTDTVGSNWLVAGNTTHTGVWGTWYGRLYYAAANASGPNKVTFTSTNNGKVGLAVLEYANVAVISPLDTVNTTDDGTTTSVTTGVVALNSDNELIVGLFGQGDADGVSLTPGAGFTLRAHLNSGSTDFAIYLADRTNASTGDAVTGTLSGGTHGSLSLGASFIPKGGSLAPSASGRATYLVSVAGGNIQSAAPGAAAWTPAINTTANSPALYYLNSNQLVVRSAQQGAYLYFADGVNWVRFNPLTNIASTWSASAGSLPVDANGNKPRLICQWRQRIVLSGLYLLPFSIYMSAVGDPTNLDYAPPNGPLASQAWQTGTSGQGIQDIPDVVTALIPYTNDVLFIGCSHSIYRMQGDPMAGGDLQLVSDIMGIAWGIAWCKGPDGTLYFCSNRMKICTMVPGNQPQYMSQQIDQLLRPVDTGATTIRLVWDDVFQGLHLFMTGTGGSQPQTHYFWEARSNSWFQEIFGLDVLNPQCCCIFDGNSPGNRLVLIGSWDGYVRAFLPSATTDDGTVISSRVMLGPILTQNLDEMLLKDLLANLGETSGQVSYDVYVGTTAEAALSAGSVASGTLTAGRNTNQPLRRAGHSVWVKLSSTSQWAMDQLSIRLTSKGKVRRRGK